jgi:hypothetical protein
MAYGDLSTTDYSKELQQTLGGIKGQYGVYGSGLGFSDTDIKALQDAGITGADLANLGLIGGPTTTTSGAYQSGGGSGVTSRTGYTPEQMQSAAMLRAMTKIGGAGQQQQAPPQYTGPIGGSAAQQAAAANPYSAWGAQALNKVMGQNTPMMINQPPSGTPSGKSGVAPTSGPTSYDISGVPAPTTAVPSVFTAMQPAGTKLGPATAGQQPGGTSDVPAWQSWYGQNIGKTLYVGGAPRTLSTGTDQNAPANAIDPGELFSQWHNVSWTAPKGMQVAPQPSATTAAPITPAAQATGAPAPAATSFAQAPGQPPPAAPGAPTVPITQPPANAAPVVKRYATGGYVQDANALLQDHVTALANAGKALYAHYGGDPNTATPSDILNFHNELQDHLAGGPPVRMRTGGVVPGNGNQDTVPAMLTPGEYVMSRGAVNRIGPQKLEAMNHPQHFQSGGQVQDDQDREAREARHRALTAPAPSSAPPPAPSPSSSQSASQAPAGTTPGPAWDNYKPVGRPNFLNTQYDPDPDPGVAQTNVNPQGFSPTQVGAGVASGLASGLAAAAQKYAESVKPWQMQPSAIPNPDAYRRQQEPITFGPMGT